MALDPEGVASVLTRNVTPPTRSVVVGTDQKDAHTVRRSYVVKKLQTQNTEMAKETGV